MAETKLIDYYQVLNLPTRADLSGIETAYARLSDDLMKQSEDDETYRVELAAPQNATVLDGTARPLSCTRIKSSLLSRSSCSELPGGPT